MKNIIHRVAYSVNKNPYSVNNHFPFSPIKSVCESTDFQNRWFSKNRPPNFHFTYFRKIGGLKIGDLRDLANNTNYHHRGLYTPQSDAIFGDIVYWHCSIITLSKLGVFIPSLWRNKSDGAPSEHQGSGRPKKTVGAHYCRADSRKQLVDDHSRAFDSHRGIERF